MLKSINIPIIHIKIIIQQRDYYLSFNQFIKNLKILNIKNTKFNY